MRQPSSASAFKRCPDIILGRASSGHGSRARGFVNADLNLGVILSFTCWLVIGKTLLSMARNGASDRVQLAALVIGVVGCLIYLWLGANLGMAKGAGAVLLLNAAGLGAALFAPFLLPAGAAASLQHWALAALSGHTALALLALAGVIRWARRTPSE